MAIGFDRAAYIHCARVYLREARARRNRPAMRRALLSWAAHARQQAAKARPDQGELFGSAQ